jgi:putative transposase
VLHVHLVLVARYRRGVLTGDMTRYRAEVPGKMREDFSAVLTECDGEDDHLHLLVRYPPKVPIVSVVNSLKGVSARRLRQRDHRSAPTASTCGPRLTSQPYTAVRP